MKKQIWNQLDIFTVIYFTVTISKLLIKLIFKVEKYFILLHVKAKLFIRPKMVIRDITLYCCIMFSGTVIYEYFVLGTNHGGKIILICTVILPPWELTREVLKTKALYFQSYYEKTYELNRIFLFLFLFKQEGIKWRIVELLI